MDRRQFLKNLGLGAVSLSLTNGLSCVRKDNPVNVVLIVADDQAYTDFGLAGHPLLKTPNLDRLTTEGVHFTHAFSPNPICTPSRAAILTGQGCWTNGCYFFGKPIKKSSVQFATLFSEAGYETFYTGKWHNDGRPSLCGFTSGENIFVGGMFPLEKGGQAKPWVSDFGGGNKRQVDRFSTSLFTDSAVRFLGNRKPDDKPFLMYVSFTTPHDPWMPPGEYAHMYPEEKIELPENFMPRPPFKWYTDWHGKNLRDEKQMPYPRTADGVRDVRRRYFGTITHMDREIGRILTALDDKNLTENTLVIFIADHGICVGAHGISGKQTLYEEGIRLPMILRFPKLKKGQQKNSELVSLIDIYPTICEAAGINAPDTIEGKSLLGLYRGEKNWDRERIFSTFDSPTKHRWVIRSVRTKKYKFIRHYTTDEEELYDLENDPYELLNLAGQKEYAAVQKQLAGDLAEWRKIKEKI